VTSAACRRGESGLGYARVRLLYPLLVLFTIWMVVDAIRRRAEFWWFLVIILFGPLGALAYFFIVKLEDFDGGGLRRAFSGAPSGSLSELAYRAQETPSIANKLAFADALAGAERYSEASDVYRDVLRKDDVNKQALHGLARSLLGAGKPGDACEPLHRLLEMENSFADYSAALDYAEALWQSGQKEDALEVLNGLVSVSSRINHRVALGHYLSLSDRKGEARDVLELALRDHAHSPDFIKRRDKKWAVRAEQMMRELS
jgi:hypothetical protein